MGTLVQHALKVLSDNKIDVNHQLDAPKRLPFGLPALDLLTGGLPLGRISTFWGQKASGKTTTALYAAKQMIEAKKPTLWVDAENSFDSNYARQLGIDLDGLVVHKRRHGETAEAILNKIWKIAELNEFGLIVVDSTGALPTARTLEGDMEDKDMGSKAKLLTRFFEVITPSLEEYDTALVMIAQLRKILGGYTAGGDTLSGGEAFQHAGSLTIKFRASGAIKVKDPVTKTERVVATILNPVITKTRISGATLHGTVEMHMRREASGVFIDPIPQLRDVGAQLALLHGKDGKPAGGSGKWFFTDPTTGEDIDLGVGKDHVAEMLKQRVDVCAALYQATYAEIQRRLTCGEAVPVSTDESEPDDIA